VSQHPDDLVDAGADALDDLLIEGSLSSGDQLVGWPRPLVALVRVVRGPAEPGDLIAEEDVVSAMAAAIAEGSGPPDDPGRPVGTPGAARGRSVPRAPPSTMLPFLGQGSQGVLSSRPLKNMTP
jgi:hypothetical protein